MRLPPQFLAVLFSIGLHGALGIFLIPSSYEVPRMDPTIFEIKWESPPLLPSMKSVTHSEEISKKQKKVTPSVNKSPSKIKRISQKSKPVDTHPPYKNHRSNTQKLQVSSASKSLNTKKITREKSYKPMPAYPWVCRKRGQEGRVTVLIQMNKEGHVIRANVQKTSGHSTLDQAALRAIKTWIVPEYSQQKVVTIFFRLNKK
jgi:protein TonB